MMRRRAAGCARPTFLAMPSRASNVGGRTRLELAVLCGFFDYGYRYANDCKDLRPDWDCGEPHKVAPEPSGGHIQRAPHADTSLASLPRFRRIRITSRVYKGSGEHVWLTAVVILHDRWSFMYDESAARRGRCGVGDTRSAVMCRSLRKRTQKLKTSQYSGACTFRGGHVVIYVQLKGK